jgi:hypothetical protein
VAKSETVMEILGEYLRELSVLVLVFFPLELSKGNLSDPASRPLMVKVAEFSGGFLFIGIIFSRWGPLVIFVKRFYSAIRREFWENREEGHDADER